MTIYDLILVCGSNLKPLHSGEKIAVWVQILSFRWGCYRQVLAPGYSFSLHCIALHCITLHVLVLIFVIAGCIFPQCEEK